MATQKQVFTEITESIDRCNHTLPGLIQFLKNGFQKLENASGGGGGGSTVEWKQIQATGTKIAEIEIDGDKTSVYAPTGATPTISVNAEDVAYSNTVSGLTADNCQEAIDELKNIISTGTQTVTSASTSVDITPYTSNKYLCTSDGYLNVYCTSSGQTPWVRLYDANNTVCGTLTCDYVGGNRYNAIFIKKGLRLQFNGTGNASFVPVNY